MKAETTLVVGIGEVGGALANVLERATGPVLRLDLAPREFGVPIDVMHMCIPFTDADRFRRTVADYINRFRPSLTVINSTVIPGTTRSIADMTRAPVAYSPVRGKHVRMEADMRRYRKFVAACDVRTAEHAQEHFRAAGLLTERLGRPETLELAKLAETSYFGVLIAFAQELNRYAGRVGASYSEAARFFEEVDFLPRQTYYPGFIGGHCVIPNLRLMEKVAPSQLFEAVLACNDLRAAELRADARGGADLPAECDGGK